MVVQSGGRKAAPNVSSIPTKTPTHQHDFVAQKYFALERKQCDSDDEKAEKEKNSQFLKDNIDPASLTVDTEIMKVSSMKCDLSLSCMECIVFDFICLRVMNLGFLT